MNLSKLVEPIGVAVWGIGKHAIKNVLPALVSADKVRLVGIHTRNKKVLVNQSELWSCKSYDKSDHMLSDNEVEVVYISTPGCAHRDNVFDSLKAKKHVLCEKPMTGNYTETRELLNFSQRQTLSLMECTVYAHHPQFKVIRELIKKNSLGEVKTLASQFGFPHLSENDFRYSPELGGGALFDAGFYPISFAIHLMNQPPENIVGNLEYSAPHKVDMGGSAILKFSNGVHAFADWGFGMYYRNEATLWGTKGLTHIERAFAKPDNLETRINLDTKKGKEQIIIKSANHFILMLNHFAEVIQDLAVVHHYGNLTLAVASTMDNIFHKEDNKFYIN